MSALFACSRVGGVSGEGNKGDRVAGCVEQGVEGAGTRAQGACSRRLRSVRVGKASVQASSRAECGACA